MNLMDLADSAADPARVKSTDLGVSPTEEPV
jgi:hypothetical protein